VRSVIEPGRTGQLVDPDDSETLAKTLTELLNDYQTRETMGRAARTRAEQMYSEQLLIDRLESVYHEVTEKSSKHKA
jgi:glycosyltransferase involved in cell wall biosynthesis